MEKIGELLFKARKQKGMTQEQLASLLNVSRQTISKWENNETKPDIESIYKLCEILDITIEELNIPNKSKKKFELDSKWRMGIACLLVGIGIGLLLGHVLFKEKTIAEISDDLIINQEVSANGYVLTYKAFMKEDISGYEASCLFDDVTWEKAEDFEVEATIDKNVLTCRKRLAKNHDVNIYLKLNNGEDEKVFYKYWVKILDESCYMHDARE